MVTLAAFGTSMASAAFAAWGDGKYGDEEIKEKPVRQDKEAEDGSEQGKERGHAGIADHVRGYLSGKSRPYQREGCGQPRNSIGDATGYTDVAPYRRTRRST